MMNFSIAICNKMNPTIYTKPQQYAIISLLILIMEADGVIDPNEIKYLDSILADFNITETELDVINSYDIAQSCMILKSMDNHNIESAKAMFIQMAKCDGYVDPRELKIIENLGS